jgi:Holliday junction resolvasome RuvABC endonuclease subunit
MILALDLGTNTGWALGNCRVTLSGTESFAPNKREGDGMRYLKFKRWLTEMKAANDIDAVYYEQVGRHASTAAAHVYGGFCAMLMAWCEHHGIAYRPVFWSEIKKFATGKGNATKAEMLAAMRAAGFSPRDDNEADAIALCMLAISRDTTKRRRAA